MKLFPISIKTLALGMIVMIAIHPLHAQLEVHDGANQAVSQANHAENLAKWTESINKATEQIQKINQVISNLDDVQGLIGKGMDQVGIDPSILGAIRLAKASSRFGDELQELQHHAGNTSIDLDKVRQELSDPENWDRYVTLSKSYRATQSAQSRYDNEARRLDQERSKAEEQLRAAKSLGETAKAQASLESVDAAQERLEIERKRAFDQLQANYIANQNQKDAWEQAARDWTRKEWESFGEGMSKIMTAHPALNR